MAQLDIDPREPFPEDDDRNDYMDDDDTHHDLAMEDLVLAHRRLDGGCLTCGSNNLTVQDDSNPDVGYYDPDRPWCLSCKGWAD